MSTRSWRQGLAAELRSDGVAMDGRKSGQEDELLRDEEC